MRVQVPDKFWANTRAFASCNQYDHDMMMMVMWIWVAHVRMHSVQSFRIRRNCIIACTPNCDVIFNTSVQSKVIILNRLTILGHHIHFAPYNCDQTNRSSQTLTQFNFINNVHTPIEPTSALVHMCSFDRAKMIARTHFFFTTLICRTVCIRILNIHRECSSSSKIISELYYLRENDVEIPMSFFALLKFSIMSINWRFNRNVFYFFENSYFILWFIWKIENGKSFAHYWRLFWMHIQTQNHRRANCFISMNKFASHNDFQMLIQSGVYLNAWRQNFLPINDCYLT